MRGSRPGWVRALVGAGMLCTAWVAGPPSAEARVALVVGNSAYRHTDPLANPSNDAEDVAKQLRRLGFEVIEGRDLTEDAFYDHLRTFSRALRDSRGEEAALFFYAGHGMQDDEAVNHLVPVDSRLRDEWDMRNMVPLDQVMRAMRGFTGLKLVILDACRDNPLRGKRTLGAGGKRGLAPVKLRDGGATEESSGTVIVYATAPDDTAEDGDGRNSPFTSALLEHIGTPGLEVGEMLERVTGTVIERTRRTGRQQVPWVSSSKIGRFHFVSGSGGPGSPGGAEATTTTGSTPSPSGAGDGGVEAQRIATEREFWQSIKDSRNPASFRAYLKRYPDGQFAVLAEIRLNELEGDAPEDPSAVETTDSADRARTLTRGEWTLVQHALGSLGFDPGLVDGYVGPKTREALMSWQRKKGYPVTGELSAEQSRVLLAVGGEAQARQEAEAARRAEEEARKAEEARRRAAAEAEVRRKREEEAKRKAEEERRRAEERRIAELTPEMVRIEGGCFQMGSPESEADRYDFERRHRVCVEAFSMGKHEVTFAEYDRFAEATGRERPDDEGWGRERRPVIDVSWHDANAYARWLSGETGRRYRLPTEAEWEYAARAGSTTAYPWGDDVGRNRANCDGCGSRWDDRQTAPVGSFEANAWGLHDTVGNVWEWTCSEYDGGYEGGEQRCSSGSSVSRVIRGGSWGGDPRGVRSAYRYVYGPGNRTNYLGFRLAQD